MSEKDEIGTEEVTEVTASSLLGDRYELGELVGYGGMAEVHRGRDVRLGRDVAIKVLRSDLAKDPSFLKRFRREAQSSAGLNHPAIVSVFDTGEDLSVGDAEHVPYIVMEYVEGRTLRDVLRTEGRLPARRAMEIVAEMCSALDFSHRNGIIHRDVKPANVMITPNGAVKVMDFGIARAIADDQATVTQTAAVIGTAQYLSPEQARGEAVDSRSDVYSTGCVLYELVTGHPPFVGDSPVAVAYQHVRETPAIPSSKLPDVPRALDSIVMKALAKNPLNRYQSAGEMRADLLRAIAGKPVEAEAVFTDEERTQFVSRVVDAGPPSGPLGGLGRDDRDDREKHNALLWVAAVLALLMLIAAGAYAVVFLGKDDGPKRLAVPSLINLTPESARDKLRAEGWVPVANPPNYGGPCGENPTVLQVNVDEGRVCTQDPAPGSMHPERSVVTFTIYKAATKRVPQVVNKLLPDAQNLLENEGFVVKPPVYVDNAAPANTVIEQNPVANKMVAPGSPVTLKVSTGKVKLVDVRGKTLTEARTTLNQAQWTNIEDQTRATSKQSEHGRVLEQRPTPNVAYPQNTPIVLIIGEYVPPPPPPPTCTTPPPSPTTTPPTTTTSPSPGTSTPPSTTPAPTTSTGLPPCR